jgi:hypothetical protein
MNKTKIREAHERLSKLTVALQKSLDACTKAESDLQSFQEELETLQRVRYDDDAKIRRRAELQYKLPLCQAECETLDQAAIRRGSELVVGMREGRDLAANILKDIMGTRLKTVSAAIRPFCTSASSAERVAASTDACAAGMHVLRQLYLPSPANLNPALHLNKARKVLKILDEALKPVPDMMQFLSPRAAAAPTGAAETVPAGADAPTHPAPAA